MKVISADPNSHLDINIFIESSRKTKYDTVYFGHIQILKYRTWALFTQSQLDYMAKEVKLISTESTTPVQNTSSGNHFTKKKAKEQNFYFNTLVFFMYYGKYFKKIIKQKSKYSDKETAIKDYNKDNYPQQQVSLFKKLPQNLLNILSDRSQIIYRDKNLKINLTNFTSFYFGKVFETLVDTFNPLDLIPQSKQPNAFKKDFIKFWENNKIKSERNDKEINIKLIATLIMIKELFKGYEFNSFKEYKSCIIKVFKDRACFSQELNLRKDISRLEPIKTIFNSFKGKNPVSCFLKWKFYSAYHKEIAQEVIKLNNRGVKFNQYKNPFSSYRFLSPRYSFDDFGNFPLPDSSAQYLYSETLNPRINYSSSIITIDGKTHLQLIDNYQDLVSCGATLHNCAGSAETIDYYKQTVSLAVYIENELKYLISIKKLSIRQFKGFKNASPSLELFQKVQEYLLKNNLLALEANYTDACIQDYSGRR